MTLTMESKDFDDFVWFLSGRGYQYKVYPGGGNTVLKVSFKKKGIPDKKITRVSSRLLAVEEPIASIVFAFYKQRAEDRALIPPVITEVPETPETSLADALSHLPSQGTKP